ILTADALKFITVFRTQIPTSTFDNVFGYLIKYLKSPHRVVHTYAAWGIERFLTIREDDTKAPRYTAQHILKFTNELFSSLFHALSHKDSQENEYIMKAIMRVTAVLKEEMAPVIKIYIDQLKSILARVC